MKKVNVLLFVITMSVVVMFLVPLAVVHLAKADAGMAFMFLLFFAVNPVFSIWMGIKSGKDMNRLWFAPIIPAFLFLASSWLLFTMGEPAFVMYAGAYLLIGVATMVITWQIMKTKSKDES